MRPESTRSDKFVSRYKTQARMMIEKESYTIIANIGDQLACRRRRARRPCRKMLQAFKPLLFYSRAYCVRK